MDGHGSRGLGKEERQGWHQVETKRVVRRAGTGDRMVRMWSNRWGYLAIISTHSYTYSDAPLYTDPHLSMIQSLDHLGSAHSASRAASHLLVNEEKHLHSHNNHSFQHPPPSLFFCFSPHPLTVMITCWTHDKHTYR